MIGALARKQSGCDRAILLDPDPKSMGFSLVLAFLIARGTIVFFVADPAIASNDVPKFSILWPGSESVY